MSREKKQALASWCAGPAVGSLVLHGASTERYPDTRTNWPALRTMLPFYYDIESQTKKASGSVASFFLD
jgi:hypothetical protein